MPKVFFTADPHYGHKNIVEALSSWKNKWGCRKGFRTVEEMNNAIVQGINAKVSADDILYCLGDWNFGGMNNQREFCRRVKCSTIHLIMGNHDFAHRSLDPATEVHEFASVSDYKELSIQGQEIVLFHYGLRVWNRQSKGSWHLYGHSHGTLPPRKNFSLDVGMDRKEGFNPAPWELDELKAYFAQRGDTIACDDAHGDEQSRPIG